MEEEKKSKKINIRRWLVLIIIAVFAVVELVINRAEFLEIKEIDETYTSIFFTNFHTKILMLGFCFLVTYIVVYINNKIIKKGMKKFFDKENISLPKLPNKSIALIMGLIAGECGLKFLYSPFLTCINASYFGITDPIFGNDLGYYMFILPFIKYLFIFLIVATLIIAIYTSIYYVIAINVCFKDGVDMDTLKKCAFIKQIKFWAIVFGILLSGYILVLSQDILTGNMITVKDSSGTELVGAGLADVTIKLWGYRILAIIVLVSVIRIVKNANSEKIRKCLISASVIPIYLVVMFGALIYFQEVYVGSSELDKEETYIGYNIEATKEAFGINIEQETIDEYETLTKETAGENLETLSNIPIVSSTVISDTITDTQDNSTYYDYSSTNLGVYEINGVRTLISLTAREIINDSNRSYNNKTYEYTHGYSIVASNPSEVDENGYVSIIQSSVDGSDDVLNISEHRIYFGLQTNNSIVVNSTYDDEEFDYPVSTVDSETSEYDGDSGLSLGFLDRVAVGITTGNYGIISSKYLDEDSKIIITRNVIERAKTLLPYIKYDDSPYLVISDDGEIYWVIDGYTTSNDYPYSQSITITNDDGTKETINYIRNSVKVLVNAYDGTTTFYITDRTDPIIMMYKNMYPDLFSDEDIPSSIAENLLYPQYLFDIQSQVIATYHDITEDMLYRADDTWSLATDGEHVIESNYTMLKTLDSEESELGIVVTYTKTGKGSLTSYLVGTTDSDGANTLSLYKFPSDSSIMGVSQLNSLIEEDETISSELETLEVSGVEVVRDIIIVPIENSILYVQPVYQVRLNEDETQVLKKVIVSSGNKVAIGDNLQEAINNLLSETNSVSVEYVDMEDIDQVIDSIIEANQNFQESVESGNLEMMGKDLETLETLLDQLETLRAQEIKEQEEQKEQEPEQQDLSGTSDMIEE